MGSGSRLSWSNSETRPRPLVRGLGFLLPGALVGDLLIERFLSALWAFCQEA